MNDNNYKRSKRERWAEFRFSIVGPLLSSPPTRGELKGLLKELSSRHWKHPITGELTEYATSTIERWYYQCLREKSSPVSVLKRKVRRDKGRRRKIEPGIKELIANQHRSHPSWSYKLHADNLQVQIENLKLQHQPSYTTIRRYMQSVGLFKERRVRNGDRPGQVQARVRIESKEVRSYEVPHVGGLWHLDFHHCSRQIVGSDGSWYTPICLAVMDDHSRVSCHVQWYLSEDTKCLVHGFSQAIQKRGLPRSLMSDNGSAMTSAEFTTGLHNLSIVHETTLPYSPYQNGKQEKFFGIVEGRLIAMLEGCKELSLEQLNDATVAWMEMEYNRSVHEEIGDTPVSRYLKSNNVCRQSPSSSELRLSFRREIVRRQRRSDGTISIDGIRFEIPSRYRHMREIRIRYAKWDLSNVHLVCPDTGVLLCQIYPLDKTANANGRRRQIKPQSELHSKDTSSTGMAPLLERLLAEYAATGLPPAYIPDTK